MTQNFMLIILDNGKAQDYLLTNAVYTIGRGRNCDFPISGALSSRHHATLVRIDNDEYDEHPGNETYYQIHDGDLSDNVSTYGLYVNGIKVDTKNLENKDDIVFGSCSGTTGTQAKFLVYSFGEIDEEREGGTSF